MKKLTHMKFVRIPNSDDSETEYWVDNAADRKVAQRALNATNLDSVPIWLWKIGTDYATPYGIARLWRE